MGASRRIPSRSDSDDRGDSEDDDDDNSLSMSDDDDDDNIPSMSDDGNVDARRVDDGSSSDDDGAADTAPSPLKASTSEASRKRRLLLSSRLIGPGQETAGAKIARTYSTSTARSNIGQRPVRATTLELYQTIFDKFLRLAHRAGYADWDAVLRLCNEDYDSFCGLLKSGMFEVAKAPITGSDSSLRNFGSMIRHRFLVWS